MFPNQVIQVLNTGQSAFKEGILIIPRCIMQTYMVDVGHASKQE